MSGFWPQIFLTGLQGCSGFFSGKQLALKQRDRQFFGFSFNPAKIL